MLDEQQRADWTQNGFFRLNGFIEPAATDELLHAAEAAVGLWIAVTEANPGNGPLWVLPAPNVDWMAVLRAGNPVR